MYVAYRMASVDLTILVLGQLQTSYHIIMTAFSRMRVCTVVIASRNVAEQAASYTSI